MLAKQLTFSIPVPTIQFNKLLNFEKKPVKILRTTASDILKNAGCTDYDWTPDWSELEKNQFTPVFVYCNMMHGGSRYPIIEKIHKKKDDEDNSVNPYVFSKDTYEVWQTKDGILSSPVALTSNAPQLSPSPVPKSRAIAATGRIKGRLFFVNSINMKDLDKEKQNGIVFKRRKVEIVVPYRLQILDPIDGIRSKTTGHLLTEEDVHPYEAWMYLGKHDYWDSVPISDLERVRSYSYTRQWQDHGITYEAPPKRWIDEPFFFFNAWEIANNNE